MAAKIENLKKTHASKKTIAEAGAKYNSEVEQDNVIKADISVEKEDIQKETIEAKKIWAEIEAGKSHRRHHDGHRQRHHNRHHQRHHNGQHQRHHGRPMVGDAHHRPHPEHPHHRPHHRPHHENPRQEIRSIIHEKEDIMDRERRDGFEKKYLPINEKKMAYEKEEIAKLEKEHADPKKIEFLEKDLRSRWVKEMEMKKELEVDGKMIPAESEDLEQKWENFERDTRGHHPHHRGQGRENHWWGRHHGSEARENWISRHPWLARHIWWARHHRGEGSHHRGQRCPGRHGHGGHGGEHGHHSRRHHHCCPVPFILAAVFAAHLISLHKFRKSLHALDSAKKAPAVQSQVKVDEESSNGFIAIPIAQ